MPYPYLNDARKQKIRDAISEVYNEIESEITNENSTDPEVHGSAVYEIQDFVGDFGMGDDGKLKIP